MRKFARGAYVIGGLLLAIIMAPITARDLPDALSMWRDLLASETGSDLLPNLLLLGGLTLIAFGLFAHRERATEPFGTTATIPAATPEVRRPSIHAGLPNWTAQHEVKAEGIELVLRNREKEEVPGFQCEVTSPDRTEPYKYSDVTAERILGFVGQDELPAPSSYARVTFPFDGAPAFADLPRGSYFVEWFAWRAHPSETGITPRIEPILLRQYAFTIEAGGAVRKVFPPNHEIYQGLAALHGESHAVATTIRTGNYEIEHQWHNKIVAFLREWTDEGTVSEFVAPGPGPAYVLGGTDNMLLQNAWREVHDHQHALSKLMTRFRDE